MNEDNGIFERIYAHPWLSIMVLLLAFLLVRVVATGWVDMIGRVVRELSR